LNGKLYVAVLELRLDIRPVLRIMIKTHDAFLANIDICQYSRGIVLKLATADTTMSLKKDTSKTQCFRGIGVSLRKV
jgi:hypothetical protein